MAIVDYFLTITTTAVIVAACLAFLNIFHGQLNRFYFTFVGVMMVASYGTNFLLKGKYLVAIGCGAVVVGIVLFTITGLLSFEADMFAVASLALTGLLYEIALDFKQVSGGDLGIQLTGMATASEPARHMLAWMGALLCLIAAFRLYRSAMSRHLIGFGDDSLLYKSLCRPAFRILTSVSVVVVVFACILGVVLAFDFGRIDPRRYSLEEAFDFAIILALGGTGRFAGVVAAPFLVLGLRQLLDVGGVQGLVHLFLQIAFVAILLNRPQGLLGKVLYERI
jgi:ABC-type branched-subunit amino acid transport system permease subunit